jgi:hypothetical protein
MKKGKEISNSQVNEPGQMYIKKFSSQEEAERYNMIQSLEMTDMQRFHTFCRMMRIGKMLASAKIVK